jgi:hypothetical protein
LPACHERPGEPDEQVNAEFERRATAVAIFPDGRAHERKVGAILLN